ncbi:hypothetical protein OG753_06055 [Streptomyces sp. NBC_00029]|uniref:hypothetical protein n=1 Tax=Streptomyces sp. NBC_00029 TaxID=2903613 RepID=UPI003253507A
MPSVQPLSPAAPARPRPRPLQAALALAGVTFVLATCWGAYRVWNGEPYPEVDPNAVGTRLRAEAERVQDDIGLPVPADVLPQRVETGACSYRGLRSLAHIDRGRSDVRSFILDWQTTDVPKDTARTAQERVRARLSQQGWKPTGQDFSDMGFGYEHQSTGDRVDVGWYEPTGTLAVSIHAPCGKVPEGYDE